MSVLRMLVKRRSSGISSYVDAMQQDEAEVSDETQASERSLLSCSSSELLAISVA